MKLTVIVVNHNMCTWLKECLNSLVNACDAFGYDILVVDNGSTDCSVQMVKTHFAQVKLLLNTTNKGIAAAYNQAVDYSRSEYVFLVTPDAITGSNALSGLIDFMDEHPEAGGASLRLVNPRGEFIAHSKYGLNAAWIKMIRLLRLQRYFPKSHVSIQKLDFTDEFETAEVDVLNHNGMMLRKAAFDKVGGFDKKFKLFGYDVDMSFRLKLAGFKNYYYHKAYIISHEVAPVKRGSVAYYKSFYGSMAAFVVKYLLHVPRISIKALKQAFNFQFGYKES